MKALEFIIFVVMGIIALVLICLAPAKWVEQSERENIAQAEAHQALMREVEKREQREQSQYAYISPTDQEVIDMRKRE